MIEVTIPSRTMPDIPDSNSSIKENTHFQTYPHSHNTQDQDQKMKSKIIGADTTNIEGISPKTSSDMRDVFKRLSRMYITHQGDHDNKLQSSLYHDSGNLTALLENTTKSKNRQGDEYDSDTDTEEARTVMMNAPDDDLGDRDDNEDEEDYQGVQTSFSTIPAVEVVSFDDGDFSLCSGITNDIAWKGTYEPTPPQTNRKKTFSFRGDNCDSGGGGIFPITEVSKTSSKSSNNNNDHNRDHLTPLMLSSSDDLSMASASMASTINTASLKKIQDLNLKLHVQESTKLEVLNQCITLQGQLEQAHWKMQKAKLLKAENAFLREESARKERDLLNEMNIMAKEMRDMEKNCEDKLRDRDRKIAKLEEDVLLLNLKMGREAKLDNEKKTWNRFF
mmetsp:Transcript_22695/g.27840  ORF Transcript_22695/g.27840 Transcript_22695/m.27840 type:complete len:391 (+) Transcript_22695:147-1319(+)